MRMHVYGAVVLAAVLLTTGVGAVSDRRLVDAAKRQDRQAVQELLTQGVDVDAPQGDGATALHWAVYWDDLGTVDLLMRAGANVNAVNDLGATPLFLACSNANGAMVEKLLAAGANPNAPVTPATTAEPPLMTAARTGSVEAVKALLAHGADVNAAESAHGQTALMWAAANQHAPVVRALIDAGADVHARSRVDRMLVMFPDVSRFRPTDRNIVDYHGGGFTPLLFAARYGDVESAKVLLAAGANVDDMTPERATALALAAHSGWGAFAAYLLDQGADPNSDEAGYTALHAAVLRGDLALVQALLAHGADPEARLKRGTPVNRTSKDFAFNMAWIGATPFWLAARFTETEIMRALIAGGADPQVTIPDGTTPLMAAAGLYARSRDDRRGRRLDPSELAAISASGEDAQRSLEAAKFVFSLGADVNAANTAGDTAVHAAAARKEPPVVQWLAEQGARVDVSNKAGQTPLSIANTFTRADAEEGGIDTEMVEILQRLGATQ